MLPSPVSLSPRFVTSSFVVIAGRGKYGRLRSVTDARSLPGRSKPSQAADVSRQAHRHGRRVTRRSN